MKVNRNNLSVALISVGTLLIVSAIVLLTLVATQVIGGSTGNSNLDTVVAFGEVIHSPTAGPPPTAVPVQGSNAPIIRLVIPSAEIDAPVVVKSVDRAGVMQSPDNAYDTAWYDFSARPGFGGNAVFAGHVDYIHVGHAVFWNLQYLHMNDLIEVHLQDGTVYRYAVKSLNPYDAATAPVDQIVGPTQVETVTLITCGGTFSSASHQYDKRLVVRAERIPDNPAQLPPSPG